MMTDYILPFIGMFGAVSTFFVAHKGKQGLVRASALLSLIVGLTCYFGKELMGEELAKLIPIYFIGGSFVGMTAPNIISSHRIIALSGFLFAFVFMFSSKWFTGFGGGLGTSACVSVVVSYGAMWGYSKVAKRQEAKS